MRMRFLILALVCAGLASTAPASADGSNSVIEHLRQQVANVMQAAPDSIEPTPVEGIYEVDYGTRIFYITSNGRYAFEGSLIDLDRKTSLTRRRQRRLRVKALKPLKESRMIVFSPAAKAKHTITVFTDTDCPYCRKLHAEMDQLNADGIKVRYMMFPRAGIGSSSYQTAVDVWCANNPRKALARAYRGDIIAQRSCDNPVEAQYRLGQRLGVRGTPAIVLDNGAMVTGYRPANRLAAMLAREDMAHTPSTATAAAR